MDADNTTRSDLPRDRRAVWLLTRLDAYRRVAEQRQRLGAADIRLLWLFTDGRPRTMREIADALNLEQSTVNRQVNAALTHGLLQRFAQPGVSAQYIEPSPTGLRTVEQDVATALHTYDQALGRLGDDAVTFLHLLERFTDAYRTAAAAGR